MNMNIIEKIANSPWVILVAAILAVGGVILEKTWLSALGVLALAIFFIVNRLRSRKPEVTPPTTGEEPSPGDKKNEE